MPRYEVAGLILEANDPSLQERLRRAKEAAQPVYCLCNPPRRAKMQMRSRSGSIILARWPNSASQHATDCPHSQVQENLTGLGQARKAITEHPDRERDLLRLDISLSKHRPNLEKRTAQEGHRVRASHFAGWCICCGRRPGSPAGTQCGLADAHGRSSRGVWSRQQRSFRRSGFTSSESCSFLSNIVVLPRSISSAAGGLHSRSSMIL